MKKFKRHLCIALAGMMLFLTGCGTQLHELTAEEEELIVQSAAYYVAKYNIQQKDGVNGYPLPDSFEEDESEDESESTEQENVGEGTESGQPQPSDQMASLAELIGHEKTLKITYEGSQVASSYKEGSAYLVEAAPGKTFYVMKFKLTNISSEDVKVDNASKSPIVKLNADGVKVKSEVTFLTSDFSTYQGTIGAGKSVETILLFEVSESDGAKITAPTLEIAIGNSTKTIKL